MAKYLPFPLDVYDHPLIQRLKPFPGAFLRLLVEDYWKTGLPLPESDYDLSNIIRTDLGKWMKYKPIVLPALNAILPKLYKDRENKLSTARSAVKNALRAVEVRMNNRVRKTDIISDFNNDSHTQFTPLPSKNVWNEGKTDAQARKAAIQANKSADDVMFTD